MKNAKIEIKLLKNVLSLILLLHFFKKNIKRFLSISFLSFPFLIFFSLFIHLIQILKNDKKKVIIFSCKKSYLIFNFQMKFLIFFQRRRREKRQCLGIKMRIKLDEKSRENLGKNVKNKIWMNSYSLSFFLFFIFYFFYVCSFYSNTYISYFLIFFIM